MKTKRKALLLTLCAVLLVTASVLGTLAYLTDTEAVTNTFAVGRVGLSLDEAKVDQMGTPDGDKRWTPTTEDPEQEYYLLPGHTYTKDPTVTVDAGSEESFVRMIVTVTFTEALSDETLATNLDSIFTGYDADKWPRHDKDISADRKTITYEYRYYTTVDGKDAEGKDEAAKLEALFTQIVVPGEYDNAQMAVLNGMTINVEAHAIQAAGFDGDEDAAWTAFDGQHK